jgi:hypothetical protein
MHGYEGERHEFADERDESDVVHPVLTLGAHRLRGRMGRSNELHRARCLVTERC